MQTELGSQYLFTLAQSIFINVSTSKMFFQFLGVKAVCCAPSDRVGSYRPVCRGDAPGAPQEDHRDVDGEPLGRKELLHQLVWSTIDRCRPIANICLCGQPLAVGGCVCVT